MLYHVILSNILALFEDIKNNNCGIDSPYDLFSVNHILQEHSKDIHKTQQCDIKKTLCSCETKKTLIWSPSRTCIYGGSATPGWQTRNKFIQMSMQSKGLMRFIKADAVTMGGMV